MTSRFLPWPNRLVKPPGLKPAGCSGRSGVFAIGLVWVLAAIGCSRAPDQMDDSFKDADPSSKRIGESIFQSRCFVCHGRAGHGDGPAAAGLGARVRDLTDPQWQGSTSDESIRTVIRNGGQSVGGSSAMAPNPDLTDDQIHSLVQYIRGLGNR